MLSLLLTPNLVLLAPGSTKNIRTSIINSVRQEFALRHLGDDLYNKLTDSGRYKLHCWAMTKHNKTYCEKLKEGDIFLLTERGTGKFNYKGVIRGITHNAAFGRELWPNSDGKVYEFIIFLSDIEKIDLDKRSILNGFGFKESYTLPGPVVKEIDEFSGQNFSDLFEMSNAKEESNEYTMTTETAGSKRKDPPNMNTEVSLSEHDNEIDYGICSACKQNKASYLLARRINYSDNLIAGLRAPLHEIMLCNNCISKLITLLNAD